MKRKKAITITAIILTVAAVAVFGAVYLLSPANFFNLGKGGGGAVAAERLGTGRVNIALLGFDGDQTRGQSSSVFRTDTIMIASLDFKSGAVSLVSIPRDSYVKIANTSIYDKINHSYVHGYNAGKGKEKHRNGLDTVIRTIEDFLGGIPIHYYVTVDMDGVSEVVDRVGGVYFDVPFDVRTDYGRGRLLLKKGYQLLDGEKFLCYVRDRGTGGDFGRASRQQGILIEAFRQIKERGKLSDLPALYRSVQSNIETSLSAAQIAQLAVFGLKVKPEQITSNVFTGKSQYAASNGQNISYVVIDEERRVELIKEAFGVEVPVRPKINLPPPLKTAPLPPEPAPSGPEPSEPAPEVVTPLPGDDPEAGPGEGEGETQTPAEPGEEPGESPGPVETPEGGGEEEPPPGGEPAEPEGEQPGGPGG